MKPSHTIKYILMALAVLGCFANFAQNEYSAIIIVLALFGLILVFTSDTVYFLRKERLLIPKEQQNRRLKIYLALVICFSFCLIIIFQFIPKMDLLIIIMAMVFIISFSALIYYISMIRPLFIESLSIMLWLTGVLFKRNHWPMAGMLITISTVMLLSYFISSIYGYFKVEKKLNKPAAWFMLMVFLMVILNLSGALFKVQHWWLGNEMGYLASLLFIGTLICMILRIKFNYPTGKVNTWRLINKVRGNFVLIFIFYSLATVYFVLSRTGVVPGFYSNSRPAAMDKLREDANIDEGISDKYYKYSDSYYDFLQHRAENKEP